MTKLTTNQFANTYSIFINGEEFVIKQNFNTENNSDNIDIYSVYPDNHLGEIEGHCIPEIDADETEITQFEKVVEEWLIEYYAK